MSMSNHNATKAKSTEGYNRRHTPRPKSFRLRVGCRQFMYAISKLNKRSFSHGKKKDTKPSPLSVKDLFCNSIRQIAELCGSVK